MLRIFTFLEDTFEYADKSNNENWHLWLKYVTRTLPRYDLVVGSCWLYGWLSFIWEVFPGAMPSLDSFQPIL
jgi:hypothetical protein